ncbi:hypothetical protein NDU88_005887 [Pleurodeles waltl]|uniref:Uncharacterized protein n=1 Tax=Pleurodeles waltl TaxID=8319 RepID=A0AAV7QGC7_PLEWA|nr:hypothetical protein NDU88_005887 [Pleurodeles waltl]
MSRSTHANQEIKSTDEDGGGGERDVEDISGRITDEDKRIRKDQRDAESDEDVEGHREDAGTERQSVRGSDEAE